MPPEPETKIVESYFKLVFLSVLGIIIIFIGIISYIAILGHNPPTIQQNDLSSFSKDMLRILIGALAGLLGGKTL